MLYFAFGLHKFSENRIFTEADYSMAIELPRPGEDVTYASPAQLWGRWQGYTALPWVKNTSGNLQNYMFRKMKKTFCSLAMFGQDRLRLEIKNKFCFLLVFQ